MKLIILTSVLAVNSLEDPHAYDDVAEDEIDVSAQPFTLDHNEDPPADAVKLTKEEQKFFEEQKEFSGFRGAYLSEDMRYWCAENGKGTYEDTFTDGCKTYLSCFGSTFRPYRSECWDGAMFDVNQKKCVWEIEIPECAPNDRKDEFCVGKEKNTKYLDPADPTCNTYIWCLFRYEPKFIRTCYSGAVYDLQAQICKPEMDVPSCAPEGAFCLGKEKYSAYADPSDTSCKTYNYCKREYLPQKKSCADHQVFDPVQRKCVDEMDVPQCAP